MTDQIRNIILVLTAFQQFLATHPLTLPVPALTAPKTTLSQTARTSTPAASPAPTPPPVVMCQPGTTHFGGQIILTRPCCNGLNIVIGQPTGGSYLFDYTRSTQCLFDERALHVGAWVLGSASPELSFCQELPLCNVFSPTQGTITMIGTSR